ncbi:MAG: thioredoxin family protein [Candidatus Lokiarchaeota archaeon]|nr:thioredoxin family protein [Candidatus Lokiarchaeota archaeon]
MKELTIIIGGGLDTYCINCSKTRDVVKKVVEKKFPDVHIDFDHINISRPESISKYGPMLPPCIIIQDTIVHEGSIPTESIVEKILEHFLK